MMIKKITRVFFILLANIILLAHVVIPHHHHLNEICLEDSIIEANVQNHYHNSGEHHIACENHFKHHQKKSTEKNHDQRSHFCPLIMVQAIIDDSSKIEIKSSSFVSHFSNLNIALNNKTIEGDLFNSFVIFNFPQLEYSYSRFAGSGMGLRGPPVFV
jgi:hypothetical protein